MDLQTNGNLGQRKKVLTVVEPMRFPIHLRKNKVQSREGNDIIKIPLKERCSIHDARGNVFPAKLLKDLIYVRCLVRLVSLLHRIILITLCCV